MHKSKQIKLNENNFRINTGKKISILRNMKNITMRQLALKSGISASAVNKIEKGKSTVSVTNIIRISQALDVKLSELIPEKYLFGKGFLKELWEFNKQITGYSYKSFKITITLDNKGNMNHLNEFNNLTTQNDFPLDIKHKISMKKKQNGIFETEPGLINLKIINPDENISYNKTINEDSEGGAYICNLTFPKGILQKDGFSYIINNHQNLYSMPENRPERHVTSLTISRPYKKMEILFKFDTDFLPETTGYNVHYPAVGGPLEEKNAGFVLFTSNNFSYKYLPQKRLISLKVNYPLIGARYCIFWEKER